MRVASTLSWIWGERPASRSRWKLRGITSTKVYSPASMPRSICDQSIICGLLNCGGYRAETMRCDTGDWSSSTIAMDALFSVSGMAVAPAYTPRVNTKAISTSMVGSRRRLHSSLMPRR